MKDIDAAYYGFRDDDDGLLVPLEVEAEKAAIGKNTFAKPFVSSIPPKTEVRRLFSKFLRPISYFGSIWELYVLDLKTNVFGRKKIQLHFPINKGLTVPK